MLAKTPHQTLRCVPLIKHQDLAGSKIRTWGAKADDSLLAKVPSIHNPTREFFKKFRQYESKGSTSGRGCLVIRATLGLLGCAACRLIPSNMAALSIAEGGAIWCAPETPSRPKRARASWGMSERGASAVAKSSSGRSGGRSARSIHSVDLREAGAVSHQRVRCGR
jgi:hypothetical protein